MIIAFDWDGTIAKKDVADAAVDRLFTDLKIDYTKEKLQIAQKTHAHYDDIRTALEKYTGITDKKKLNEMMSSIFRIHYVAIVNERKDEIFFEGMKRLLLKLKSKGHNLVIFSTLRQDLIEETLHVLQLSDLFIEIIAEPADLRYSKIELIKMLKHKPHFAIGDRIDDMQAGKSIGAKTILTSWGNHTKEAEDKADCIAKSSQEILDYIKKNE